MSLHFSEHRINSIYEDLHIYTQQFSDHLEPPFKHSIVLDSILYKVTLHESIVSGQAIMEEDFSSARWTA